MKKEEEKGNSSNSNLPVIITAIIGLLIVTLGGEVFEVLSSNNTSSETATTGLSDKVLAKQADKINRNLPMMVDSVTKMLDIHGINNTVTTDYKLVNVLAKQVDTTQFNRVMKKKLLNNHCTRPETKILRDNNVTMRYNYRDKEGKFITLITIKANECE